MKSERKIVDELKSKCVLSHSFYHLNRVLCKQYLVIKCSEILKRSKLIRLGLVWFFLTPNRIFHNLFLEFSIVR